MKIIAYEVREDERKDFERLAKELNIEIFMSLDILNEDTVKWSEGYDGVTTLGQSKINAVIIDQLYALKIRYIATRTIGYNHIDYKYAYSKGIRVSSANYAPNGVSDYTIMLMLMSIRHYKQALFRANVNDYSLTGLRGTEMKDLVVGVIGTGRIGSTVITALQGFGCEVLAYDKIINDKVRDKAMYVDLETLYAKSDIITLHIPYTNSTYHLIDKEAINMMKDGVVLINCARGEMMDLNALIDGIESKKIGALGLDCVENEAGIYHLDRRSDIISNREMAYLRQFPNVVMTQHMAFYTEAAVKSMVECAVESIVLFAEQNESACEIVYD